MRFEVSVPGWVEPFKDDGELWDEHMGHSPESKRKSVHSVHKSHSGKKTTRITFVYSD